MMSRIEWGFAILATAAALRLHWCLFRSVKALWRDEAGIVNIAFLPSFGEVWNGLFHDHCPLLFPAILRLWSALTGGPTDLNLHLLGMGIGLLWLSMLWIATRRLANGLPLLSLGLVAVNLNAVSYGDSLRAYGLGSALVLVALVLMWDFVKTPAPCWRRGIAAALAAVLSVQTLYQNAFLVFAVCVAGIAVCLWDGRRKMAAGVLGIGVVAACSLLPYAGPIHRSQQWWAISQMEDTFPNFISQVFNATAADRHVWFFCVWFVMVLLAVVLGIFYVGRRRESGDAVAGQKGSVLFAGVALVAGLAGYGMFFGFSKMFPQVWYFLPVLSFVAVTCDVILPRMHPAIRAAVMVVSLVSMVLAYPLSHAMAQQRRTNVDLAAGRLSREAVAGDLVIVCPWHYGITFGRYYQGAAPWITVPPVEDCRFHRYDVIISAIEDTNVLGPVFQRAGATLSSGHRVWIVGDLEAPDVRSPAPAPPGFVAIRGQKEFSYYAYWSGQLGYFLGRNATNSTPIAVPTASCNPMETVGLSVVSGWRQ